MISSIALLLVALYTASVFYWSCRMRIHVLGVGGTFMGSLAILAKQMGCVVTGVDGDVYEPMASALKEHAIATANYQNDKWLGIDNLDCVIIGNALSRGHPSVEKILREGIAYTSGPAWLAEHVLRHRRVIAVAGTHGKTTTTTFISWLMTQLGLDPGYLIGGVPMDLPAPVALGTSEWFIVEADEYDSAFFDKRPKFMHYAPEIAIINNIEFDHADIYADLASIKKQFAYWLRLVPDTGHIVYPGYMAEVAALVAEFSWSNNHAFGGKESELSLVGSKERGPAHIVHHGGKEIPVNWSLLGTHNAHNAQAGLLALAATGHSLANLPDLGVFRGVKRRLQLRFQDAGFRVYEDFAHHPTAVAGTLDALRAEHIADELMAIIHVGSNSMQLGVHDQELLKVLEMADKCVLLCDDDQTSSRFNNYSLPSSVTIARDFESLLPMVNKQGDQTWVILSNKSCESLIKSLLFSV
jgi:UDP-N-acetylmuramate: L-alanyl-gamma-D-glutamyl-meso-diaminopimelate ligase